MAIADSAAIPAETFDADGFDRPPNLTLIHVKTVELVKRVDLLNTIRPWLHDNFKVSEWRLLGNDTGLGD